MQYLQNYWYIFGLEKEIHKLRKNFMPFFLRSVSFVGGLRWNMVPIFCTVYSGPLKRSYSEFFFFFLPQSNMGTMVITITGSFCSSVPIIETVISVVEYKLTHIRDGYSAFEANDFLRILIIVKCHNLIVHFYSLI